LNREILNSLFLQEFPDEKPSGLGLQFPFLCQRGVKREFYFVLFRLSDFVLSFAMADEKYITIFITALHSRI
ncbi:MAG: hypothetical protein ACK56F_30595, partial [bacterium]